MAHEYIPQPTRTPWSDGLDAFLERLQAQAPTQQIISAAPSEHMPTQPSNNTRAPPAEGGRDVNDAPMDEYEAMDALKQILSGAERHQKKKRLERLRGVDTARPSQMQASASSVPLPNNSFHQNALNFHPEPATHSGNAMYGANSQASASVPQALESSSSSGWPGDIVLEGLNADGSKPPSVRFSVSPVMSPDHPA